MDVVVFGGTFKPNEQVTRAEFATVIARMNGYVEKKVTPVPYKIDHIPITSKKRTRLPLDIEYIIIQSTSNPTSTVSNKRAWLTNPSNSNEAGYHIVVDDKEIIECIPLTEVAWHATDGYNGTGNRKSIGIEMCESGDRLKTIMNTVHLVASLLKRYNLNVDKLRRHYDWHSKKTCPRILSENNWEGWRAFKIMVERELNK